MPDEDAGSPGDRHAVTGRSAAAAASPAGGITEEIATPDAAGDTTGRSVLAGGLWHGLGLLLPQVYTVVISVVAARILGPVDLGRQSFIAFVEISTVMLVSAGLAGAVTRFSGEALGRGRPDLLRSLVARAWWVMVAAAVAGGLMMVGFAAARPALREAWLLAAVVVVLGSLHSIPTAVLVGLQLWRRATLAGLLTATGGTVAIVTVLVMGGGIVGMFLAEACMAVVSLVWLGGLTLRSLRAVAPGPAPRGSSHRPMARFAALASVNIFFTFVVWSRTEFFFLERYREPAEIAVYSIAFAAVAALTKVPDTMIAVFSPAVATLYGAGARERIRRGFSRALRLVMTASLAMTGGVLALGPRVIELAYGREFRSTGVVLITMMAIFPVVAVGRMGGSLLAGLGVAAFPLKASIAATVVNVCLDLVLIERYGVVGAAVANGAAQVTISVLLLSCAIRRVGGVSWMWTYLLCAAVTAAAAGLAAWAVVMLVEGIVGLLAGGFVGIVSFLGLAGVIRILSPEDLNWLNQTAGQRLHGLVGSTCRWLGHREVSAVV